MRYKNVNLNVKEAAKRRIQINCDLEEFFFGTKYASLQLHFAPSCNEIYFSSIKAELLCSSLKILVG